jgi:antitoxin CptB
MDQDVARLRWRCRRGMKELDLMLLAFMDNAYGRLATGEKADFARLLEAEDAELFDYLMGYSTPRDKELCHVIDKIRSST